MFYYHSHPYADDALYSRDSDNPFAKHTTEYRICDNLIKLTNQCIQKEYYLDDSYLLKDDFKLPRRPANPAFVKRLINKFSFNFSVSMLEYEIFQLLPAPKGKEPYERFDSFIEKMIPILEKFHYHYLKNIMMEEPRKRTHNIEAIKRILLSAALNDSAKSMNLKELAMYINNQLLDITLRKYIQIINHIYLKK
jgi:hypothetical protein